MNTHNITHDIICLCLYCYTVLVMSVPGWDGVLAADSVPVALYQGTHAELAKPLLKDTCVCIYIYMYAYS